MSDTAYLGQSADLILGQEFLTWLWFRTSTGSIFQDAKGQPFSLGMEQRIVVQGGEGERLETATVAGLESELREARMGLTTGKKVTRALVRFDRAHEAWQVTLKAADFSLGSLKPPKVESDNKDDHEGLFLEKMYLLETALELLDVVYRDFLNLRLGDGWQEETQAMRKWISAV